MAKKISLSAEVDVTPLTVQVTGAPGGAGVAVAFASASSAVILTNTSSAAAIQYKVDSGSWADLPRQAGVTLPINFAASLLYLRRTSLDGGDEYVHLSIEGIPVLMAGGNAIASGSSYTLGVATSSVLGGVKPDKTTLAVDPTTGVASSIPSVLSISSKNVPVSGAGSYVAASYPKTKAALKAVLAGTGNIKICLNGDSTMMGIGANNVSSANNRIVGPVESFTRALNSVELPASCLSFHGDSNFYVTTGGASTGGAATGYAGYDPRVNVGAGGWVETVAQTAGGAYFQNTTTTNMLTFYNAGWAPTDTVVVRYKTGPSATSFNITRSGWTTQLVTPALTDGMASITLTGASSAAGIGIVPTVIGTVEILGIEAYDNTIKRARVHQIAWSGGSVVNWISTGNGADWNPLPALLNQNFDLIIGQFGINEWGNAVNVATFKANLITWVTANLSNGSEIIIMTGYPSALSVATYAVCKTYIDAMYEVAATYNLMIIDVWRKVGSQDVASVYGLYFDTKHPRNPTYQNTMESVANVVRSLAVM